MVERVLHQRLQRQLRQHAAAQLRLDMDLIAQDIPVAHLLDLQIAAHVDLLLAEGDDISALAQGTAEEIRKARDHLDGLFVLPGLHEPDDGIERVVEKMRVDLALQQGQLHRAELVLLLPVELHLLLQVLRHVLKTAAERLQRLILGHDRLPRGKIAPADRLRALAQSVDRLRDAAADGRRAAHEHAHEHQRAHGDQPQLEPESGRERRLQRIEIPGLVVEIGIEILLDELGEDIDVGLELLHAGVIALGLGDLQDALAQIFTEIDRARDGLPALPVLRAGQQLLRERGRLVDLLQRQRLAVGAVDDVVIHFEVDVLLEVLVELGGADDIGRDDGILVVVQKQDRQRRHQNHADKQQHAPQQPPQLSVERAMGLTSPHGRLRFPRGSCSACSPASF